MPNDSTVNPGSGNSSGQPLKILLVADEVFRGDQFMAELSRHIDGRSREVSVFVVAPALAHSGLEHELAAVDEPIEEADQRLGSILAELKDVGIEAVGEVGDEDPVVAIGDGLREFGADEIFVVAHEASGRKYAEKHLWEHIEHEFHPPLVEIIVGDSSEDGRPPEVVEVHRDGGRAVTEEEEIDRTRNFPPLTPRDAAGIVVGLVGTIALGLVAVAVGSEEGGGNLSGGAAVVLLLAIGSFLINAANIVGLVFFQSIRYTGIWERFFASTSLFYTTGALIVSLLIWLV